MVKDRGRKVSHVIGVLMSLFFLYSSLDPVIARTALAAEAQSLDPQDDSQILATAGDEVITLRQFKERYPALSSFLNSGILRPEDIRPNLETIIFERLILQESLRLGLEKDPEIRSEIDRLLISNYLMNRIEAKISVSDGNIREYYEGHKMEFRESSHVRFRHILVRTEREAGAILQRISGGEAFEELAKESIDPASREGMILQGKEDAGFDPALSGVIQDLPEGEVSGVVRSDFGYHLIKLIEKSPATYKNYKEVAREIRSKLEEEKRLQSVAEVRKELWEKSQVTIKEPIVPAITHAGSGDEKKGSQVDSPHLVSQTGAQEEEDPAPEIRLMAETYDLGTIPPERQTRSILIKNSGEADLLIKGVRTACPCTLAEIQPNKLRPGESGILTVTFDPSLYEGKGVLTQTIMIESNDPNHPRIPVSLQAVVSSHLEVSAKQE